MTHHLNGFAWMLFAIIFFWTPVHFWALAILLKEDYTKAGIPMLPSVRGERVTVVQIAFYTFLTVGITLAPYFLALDRQHLSGWRDWPERGTDSLLHGQTLFLPGASTGVASVSLLDAVPGAAVSGDGD